MAGPSDSVRDYVMAAEAVLMLGAARIGIALLPLKVLGRYRGRSDLSQARTDDVHRVTLAVERAARHMPVAMVCYPRALAVHWMLRRRGVPTRLHFGIRPPSDDFAAHVWTSLDELVICGSDGAAGFASVASFPVRTTSEDNRNRTPGDQ